VGYKVFDVSVEEIIFVPVPRTGISMLGLLQKAVDKILLRTRRSPDAWILIDLREDAIRLPDGTTIRREDIISIDTQRKVIIYRDKFGRIREANYA